jgi:carboxypeptidase family protein
MRSAQALILTSCLLTVAGRAGAVYREVAVKDGGRISGRVRVVGAVPVLPPQPVFKQKEVCGETQPDPRLVTGKDGVLENAVVSLANIDAGKPVPRNTAVTLDNAKCTFVPHVASATVGQMLHLHNSDPFLHDAHALLGSRTLFNVAILKDQTVRKPLAEPGLIHLNCNVRHTWMHAYLYVAEHPYHAVTAETGQFVIDEVPPGTYTLRVWHEMLGSVDRSVTVEQGKTTTVDIDLQAVAPETP